MTSSLRCSAFITVTASLLISAAAAAATSDVSAPHLRPVTAEARAMVDQLLERSATARGMVEQSDQSDVIVYIRYRSFPSAAFDGRIGLLAAADQAGCRFLVLELAMGRTLSQQMVALGHELRHAVEIANAPWIVDARTLSTHYAKIGSCVTVVPGREMFETQAARDAAAEVRQELTRRTVTTQLHESR